jgi:cyclase
MLRPRVIPCLLVHNGGLVKTVRFADPKYVGDPLNAVRIFNEKEVDELIVVDIDASVRGRQPDYDLIAHLAAECRMPLCYGGGVTTVEQVERLIELGVEKVAVSSVAMAHPEIVPRMAEAVGSQSVVVVLDVKAAGPDDYRIWTHNGTRPTGTCAIESARQMEALGVGEIVINAIDQDGVMKGYDLNLISRIWERTTVPITALGGAGSLDDIRGLIARFGIIGAAAGSLFVFKGPYRAVLINYPRRAEKDALVLNPA